MIDLLWRGRQRPTPPHRPSHVFQPARCPDCDRMCPADKRGGHFCSNCGVAW